jgi:hypothetical protein
MSTEILVELFDADVEPEQLDELARSLRRELLELDVDDVEPATAGDAPPGTRGIELAVIGALLVKAQASGELLTKVVGVLRRWLRASPAAPARTVRVTLGDRTLELGNATDDQQHRLVEEFLSSARTADAAPLDGSH